MTVLLKEKTSLEHLEELRRRLLISLGTIGVLGVGLYFVSGPLLDFLILPLQGLTGTELYFHSPYEAFLTRLKVSFFTALLAASPVLFTELWLFLAPGLYRHEKKILLRLALTSAFLFLFGTAFAFWILIPMGLRFLLSFQTEFLKPLLGIGSYLSFLIGTVLASGVLFVLPVVMLGLVRLGIVSAENLRKARRVVVVLIFILAAVLTPSPDPVTQLFFALPLLVLFEGCLWISRRKEKQSEACHRS